jgi:hypothetical protein
VSLYGYPREPEPTDGESPDSRVPQQRVASEPVAVPAVPSDPLFGALPDATQRVPVAPVSQVPQVPSVPSPSVPPFPIPPFPVPPFPVPQPPVAPVFGQPAGDVPSFPEPGFPSFGGSFPAFEVPAKTEPSSAPPSSAPPSSVPPRSTPPPERASHRVPEAAAPLVDVDAIEVPAMSLDDEIDAAMDEPPIPPWDRKPLVVVIAAAAVLVLIAILSGVASAEIFGPDTPPAATWREPQPPNPDGPTASGPPTPAAATQETITLSGVGDVIMGTAPGSLPPNNGVGFFDPVKSALAADLVMGNLETPLSGDTGYAKCGAPPSTDCFQFTLPPSYANYLHDAGFQVLNLANNHTFDMGQQGLANTRDALTAAGVQYTGGVGQITYATVKGIKVAVLGFSVYSWGASLNNIPAAVDLVKQADAEADLVVIQMQGGAEGSDKTHVPADHELFLGEDRGDLIAFSHAVIDAGADAVFGHGPHVMRGMEFYKGRLIAYSLGNFCGYKVLGTAGNLGVGGVLKVTLARDGTWAGGKLVATEMVSGGLVAPDPDQRAIDLVAGLSKTDFGSAAPSFASDGTITPPAA